MTDLEQRKAAKEFAEYWKDRGNEKSESQKFWISLLTEVFGVKDIKNFINFEERVDKLMDGNTGWVDVTIPSTKVLIEQKSSNVELDKKIKHGDVEINAFQQAWMYSASLNYDEKPRWIVTCNFKSFRIYDMNNRNSEPEEILLKDLPKEYYRLSFLIDSKNEHIKKEEEVSFKAGEIVGVLYDAFSKQYNDLTQEFSQKSLNELCVRLVFCLYAEDAGLFGRKNVFHDYLAKYEDLDQMRKALIELFKVLDTPLNERDPYLEDELNQFPYVNGGLFSNENIEIPRFTSEIRETLLAKASDDFDWSEISPTIFGAVFESTLNPETRRAGGMHYTSVENIHKVIDPLFLDDLRKELDEALIYKNEKTRNEALDKFQEHIGSLKFMDPACGSGNFLTETYLSLRRMENEAIEAKQKGRVALDFGDVVKVHIDQFYGIEINDFAVKVATTALWIAESQMLQETERLLSRRLQFLPLKTYTNIVEGNALRIDWNEVIQNTQCDYIMGNPPFVGYLYQSAEQKKDIQNIFKDVNKSGTLDYVACWYGKALEYIYNTNIKVALVSTNSITQGESVSTLWDYLFSKGVVINFAYRTFIWDSEASLKAHVHCVIIGFSTHDSNEKYIYDNGRKIKSKNINGYLIDGKNCSIEKRRKPLCKVKPMAKGSQLIDGGNFTVGDKDDYQKIVNMYPDIKNFIKRYYNAQIFLNNSKEQYVLDLNECDPSTIQHNNYLLNKVLDVKKYRDETSDFSRSLSNQPSKYYQYVSPKYKSIIIPQASSEKRRYIPMGFAEEGVIYTNQLLFVDNADLYDFGILESNVHMAWMRLVAGRLKSDYRYSKDIVYNNFPWPTPTAEQKKKIETTAQNILNARQKYNNSSLAEMYGENMFLYSELLKAHQENDRAVWEAYGKCWSIKSETECVAKLMEMYQELANKEEK